MFHASSTVETLQSVKWCFHTDNFQPDGFFLWSMFCELLYAIVYLYEAGCFNSRTLPEILLILNT